MNGDRISVVIPALHEADTIAACIAGVRAIDGGESCEVIVVDGDPAGTTLAAIGDAAVVGFTAPRGRARQMNAGARRARGDVLVFLHADTTLPATAFADIGRALADPYVACGAFGHRFDSPRRIHRVMSALVTWGTRLTRMPYGDQALFFRRDYFEGLGGFAPIEIMEDREIVGRVRRRGDRLRVVDTHVRTSCRRLVSEGTARRVVTNWAMLLAFGLGVPARRLARFYRPQEPR